MWTNIFEDKILENCSRDLFIHKFDNLTITLNVQLDVKILSTTIRKEFFFKWTDVRVHAYNLRG